MKKQKPYKKIKGANNTIIKRPKNQTEIDNENIVRTIEEVLKKDTKAK